MYLFHGKCAKRETERGSKRSTIIFELRRAYMHGLNVFGVCTPHFSELADYLKEEPAQMIALTDSGFKASKKFIALWEMGLRRCGEQRSRALGKNAMQTPKNWDGVSCQGRVQPHYLTLRNTRFRSLCNTRFYFKCNTRFHIRYNTRFCMPCNTRFQITCNTRFHLGPGVEKTARRPSCVLGTSPSRDIVPTLDKIRI